MSRFVARMFESLRRRFRKVPDPAFKGLVFFWLDVGGPVCGEFDPAAAPGAEGRRGLR